MKDTQKGFIGIVVVILFAALAVGGGVYYVKKAKEQKSITAEQAINNSDTSNTSQTATTNQGSATQLSTKTNISTTTGASIKGTLQELLARNKGKNLECKGTWNTTPTTTIQGTAFISNDMVRGDSTTTYNGVTTYGSLIVKNDTMYIWQGTHGFKVTQASSISFNEALGLLYGLSSTGAVEPETYTCKSWTPDASKFIVPVSVQFTQLTDHSAVNLH